MSSFVKTQKSHRRLHRERVNVLENGFLERKKDYQNRATEFKRRKDIFTKLRKKALDKNPDEFFFRMKSSKLIDGIHYDIRKDDDEYQPEELALMQSQDLNYINYKRSIDAKKIEKMQSELHLVGVDPNKPKNTHIFFVDDKKSKKKIDIAEKMRLDKKSLKSGDNLGVSSSQLPEESNEILDLKYRRLKNRMNREKLLRNLSAKMQIKKQLLNKKEVAKKIQKGTKDAPPVYQWKMERKK